MHSANEPSSARLTDSYCVRLKAGELQASARISEDLDSEIGAFADEHNLTRSDAIRELLQRGSNTTVFGPKTIGFSETSSS